MGVLGTAESWRYILFLALLLLVVTMVVDGRTELHVLFERTGIMLLPGELRPGIAMDCQFASYLEATVFACF